MQARQLAGLEQAGVGALQQGNTGVRAQLVGNLAVAGIDGQHPVGTVLQQAVGEASGRRADIGAGAALHIEGPGRERGFELQAAAAHIAHVLAEQTQGDVGRHRSSWFIHPLFGHQHATGKDQRLRPLA